MTPIRPAWIAALCFSTVLSAALGGVRAEEAEASVIIVFEGDEALMSTFELARIRHLGPDSKWRISRQSQAAPIPGQIVIRISKSIAATAVYRLSLEEEKRKMTSGLTPPTDATTSMIADALLLKCLFLVESARQTRKEPRQDVEETVEATPEDPNPRSKPRGDEAINDSARSTPPRPTHRITTRRYSLSLGVLGTFGLDRPTATAGFELASAARLWRWLTLRAAAGGSVVGWWNNGMLDYWTLPIRAMLGAEWDFRTRWCVGGYAGYVLDLIWIEHDAENKSVTFDVAMGVGIELRGSVAIHDRVALGLSVQGAWQHSDSSTAYTITSNGESGVYRHPSFELGTAFELIFKI